MTTSLGRHTGRPADFGHPCGHRRRQRLRHRHPDRLDGIAALIILVPILLPVAQQSCGIDPIHFGIITCVTLSLGLLTPPVGAGLYVASAINNVSLPRIT
ncbi:MAG: TRAP transporter large permease subunit [Billgrantia sp.]|uniref:TRAP transporter large permease subunit n=1 Tax=Billgrantia desiderata TaxID=52021 RepID=UPI001F2FEA81|nr:TRAP transporter large permease subunit [Halomonas desiderata]